MDFIPTKYVKVRNESVTCVIDCLWRLLQLNPCVRHWEILCQLQLQAIICT